MWHGDNRGFSNNPASSYRTGIRIGYETDNQSFFEVLGGSINSSSLYGANAISETDCGYSCTSNSIDVHSYGDNDALIPGVDWGGPTWDIDMHSSLTTNLTETQGGKQLLQISGNIKGDRFPAAEAFVTDDFGNSVFLGVGAAGSGKHNGPFVQLAGDKKLSWIQISISIVVSANGKFEGVQVGDNIVNLDEWNSSFSDAKTQRSYRKGRTRTNPSSGSLSPSEKSYQEMLQAVKDW